MPSLVRGYVRLAQQSLPLPTTLPWYLIVLAACLYLAFVVATVSLARHRLRITAERRRRARQRQSGVPGEVWDLEAWEDEPEADEPWRDVVGDRHFRDRGGPAR